MSGQEAADGAQQPASPGARGHTRRQRLVRTLFYFFGPAQNGPPPYATPEELQLYRGSPQATPPATPAAPRGFEFREYTDSNGVVHRYLVGEAPYQG